MAQERESYASETISEPEVAHIQNLRRLNDDEQQEYGQSRAREATELTEVSPGGSREDTPRLTLKRLPTTASERKKPFQPLRKFWRHQVSIVVPHDSCRDHLALERTFLAWLRTSLALSMTGVVVAQLFRLQVQGDDTKLEDTAYRSGIPVAAVFNASSIVVISIGAYHFWKQQNAIVRSKIHKGGWEMWTVGLLCIAMTGTLLGVILSTVDD